MVKNNETGIIKSGAYFFASLSACIIVVILYILPDSVPLHFNFDGVVDRIGTKYELLIMGTVFWIFPVLLIFIFDIIKMSLLYKNIGFAGSVVMSLAFIAVTVYFLVKISLNGVIMIISLSAVVSVIVTFVGVCAVIISAFLPRIVVEKLANSLPAVKRSSALYNVRYYEFISALVAVAGFAVSIGAAAAESYFSLLFLFGGGIVFLLSYCAIKIRNKSIFNKI